LNNQLVIIGNGFDLSHGINSKYEHFILNYLYKCLRELNKYENLKTDKYNCSLFYNEYSNELIHLKTKSWTDVQSQNEHYNTEKREWYQWFENNETENFQELFEQLESQGILKFPKNKISLIKEILNSKIVTGWVDLEVLYFDLLLKIKNSSHYSVESFDKQWSLLKKEFIQYLKLTLEQYYSCSFVSDNLEEFKNQYVFKYIFDGYIYGDENTKPVFEKYYYLNFNYTDLIEKKYRWKNNQIHGSLESNVNFSDFLFGYGNTKNKDYNSLKDERNKEYSKNLKDNYYSNKNNRIELFDWIKDSKYEIKIIGHSCGESDRTILNRLLSHNNCLSIKIYSRDKVGFEEIRDNLWKCEKFEDCISDKIIPYNQLNNNIISQFNIKPKIPVINNSYIESCIVK
jgi:hypothetical protein